MVANVSCFAQVLSLVDRYDFAKAVRQNEAEKGAKGFKCWDQFVAMMFCQLGAANSLREITGGLATAMGKLVHLGMKSSPARSTLAYANEHRPWQLYQQVFESVLWRCRNLARKKKRKFRFKNPLRSLDATVINLCLEMYDWACFRRTKGAIKLHLLLDHRGYLPCWALVTDGRTHDVEPARSLSFDPGTIVAMDRAYIDYAMLNSWTESEVYFVTRAKKNMAYEVEEFCDVPTNGNVISDEVVRLTGVTTKKKYPGLLRLVTVWDKENEREIKLLSNIFRLAASTVGRIYRERWQIELFFKALKQNLKIKTFVGTSENAVQIQIWTALIAMLLLKFLQLRSSWKWSLSNLAAMLRFNLLTYRDLWSWLDSPYSVPIIESVEVQLELFETIGQQNRQPGTGSQHYPVQNHRKALH
jgi:hypothetical protein